MMDKLTLTTTTQPPLGSGADSILEYFKFTLNLGYTLCLIPLRLRNDASGGKWRIQKHRPHQLACGLVHALILYESLVWVWMLFNKHHHSHQQLFHNHNSPDLDGPDDQKRDEDDVRGQPGVRQLYKSIDFLQHLAVVMSFGSVFGFLYTFWTKSNKFDVLIRLMTSIEFIGTPSGYRGPRQRLQIYVLGTLVTLTCIGLALTDTTLHEASILDGQFVAFIQSYFVEGQQLYLFQDDLQLPDTIAAAYAQRGLLYTALALVGTAVHVAVAVPEFFVHHVLVDLFVVLSAIALWSASKQFLAYARAWARAGVRGSEDGAAGAAGMAQVLAQYELLKCLVRTVNGITGVLFLCVVSISIPFYVLWAANSYFNIHNSIHFFIYFGLFFTLLAIAADMHAKAGRFYNWICNGDHAEHVGPSKMISLSMDMNSNQIALRGAGVFTMTYRFFGTVLSLLVTYTVIIIQYQNSCSGACASGTQPSPESPHSNTSSLGLSSSVPSTLAN